MRLVVVVVLMAILAVLLDRVGCAAERRGWIYWRNHRPSGSMTATMLAPLHLLTQPSYSHVARAREQELVSRVQVGNGEPPIPGPGAS